MDVRGWLLRRRSTTRGVHAQQVDVPAPRERVAGSVSGGLHASMKQDKVEQDAQVSRYETTNRELRQTNTFDQQSGSELVIARRLGAVVRVGRFWSGC